MSTPREDYESAVTTANETLSHETWAAYAEYQEHLAKAWYNYQVRTGIIPVPEPEGADDSGRSDEAGRSEEESGDGDSVRADDSEAPEHGDTGSSSCAVEGTADSPAPQGAG